MQPVPCMLARKKQIVPQRGPLPDGPHLPTGNGRCKDLCVWLWQRSRQLHYSIRKISETASPQTCLEGTAESGGGVGAGTGQAPGVMDGLQWIGNVLYKRVPCPPVCPLQPMSHFSGIPFPITLAWALGKLYYENEQ